MFEDMLSFAENNNLELVVTGYYIDTFYDKDKYYRETKESPDVIYKSQQEFRKNSYKLYDNHLLYTP